MQKKFEIDDTVIYPFKSMKIAGVISDIEPCEGTDRYFIKLNMPNGIYIPGFESVSTLCYHTLYPDSELSYPEDGKLYVGYRVVSNKSWKSGVIIDILPEDELYCPRRYKIVVDGINITTYETENEIEMVPFLKTVTPDYDDLGIDETVIEAVSNGLVKCCESSARLLEKYNTIIKAIDKKMDLLDAIKRGEWSLTLTPVITYKDENEDVTEKCDTEVSTSFETKKEIVAKVITESRKEIKKLNDCIMTINDNMSIMEGVTEFLNTLED